MLRRAPHRRLGGLWQCVAGSIEAGEGVEAAALREVEEETSLRGEAIEAFYSLDYVASFLWQPCGGVISSVYFGLRVGPTTEPVLSHEHDAAQWLAADAAMELCVWPAYREAIARIGSCLLDPDRARWFQLAVAVD